MKRIDRDHVAVSIGRSYGLDHIDDRSIDGAGADQLRDQAPLLEDDHLRLLELLAGKPLARATWFDRHIESLLVDIAEVMKTVGVVASDQQTAARRQVAARRTGPSPRAPA
jgi:hypothetical protein